MWGCYDNSFGAFRLHFYIINTTDIEYQASYILSNELLNENISVGLLILVIVTS